jgi:hypothetical protein
MHPAIRRFIRVPSMISSRIKGILPTIGRIVLSLSVFFVGWGILFLMMVFHAFLNQESGGNNLDSYKAALPITSSAAPPKSLSLWPQYPVHGSITTHDFIINGASITVEEWKSSSLPKNILDYYETQLMARGWRDGMKELHSQAEESAMQLQNGGDETAKFASLLLQGVQPNGNSSLELQRSGWSMSIVVEPSGESINQSRVTITVAPVTSLSDLSTTIAAASKPASFENDNKPLDIVRKSNGERYHTTIASTRINSDQAFKDSIAELYSKDWRMCLSPFRHGHSDIFAWLIKGNQYATLSVKALPQGQGSSVTLTEVTPETRRDK